jgi:O-antigen ligase
MKPKPKRAPDRTAKRESTTLIAGAIQLTVIATTVAALTFVAPSGLNSFRFPKELVLRGQAIVLLALVGVALALGLLQVRALLRPRPELVLAGLVLAWMAVATAASTNARVSLDALLLVGAAVVFFVVTLAAGERLGLRSLVPLIIAGLANSVLYLLQVSGTWQPFTLPFGWVGRQAGTALLGNANDVGSALLPVFIAAVVASAAVTRKRSRWLYGVPAALVLFVIFFSRSTTASIAAVAVLLTIGLLLRPRATAVAAALLASIAVVLVLFPAPRRAITGVVPTDREQIERAFGGRIAAYAAAVRMARDHPLTGIGPGTFSYNYFRYKIEVDRDHPRLYRLPLVWESAHSDHLEFLAEGGVPAYLLFVAALALIAGTWTRRRAPDASPARRASSLLGPALASGVAVLTIAQYPFQLASATIPILFLAALALAWSRRDEKSD